MAYLTYGELHSHTTKRASLQLLSESAMEKALSARETKAVFISHQSDDKGEIPYVVNFLQGFGASHYVDLNDKSLPQPPTAETANTLYRVIGKSLKLIVIVTKNSARSKWIPWEVGAAHALLGQAQIAMLPLSEITTEEAWAKQEYMGLYPQIVKRNVQGVPRWIVIDPRDSDFWHLDYWLQYPCT